MVSATYYYTKFRLDYDNYFCTIVVLVMHYAKHRHLRAFDILTEGKEVLLDGGSVACRSFPSVVSSNDAQLKPKDIHFTDSPQLDSLLANITLVRHDFDFFLMIY